ncbi:hypothetical protein JavanS54_0009 [Streptococcus satellite phage Javan54]|uniref:hypothetical protein n=1 Tax=Streptococcus agalactiae TaxID=1311 RepID=UPI000332E5FD|nr:hypothetical protein [Streptococcus agalactiae]QBX11066.1 hypothetical protein JavanS54_0009 [Streptococcus satellite phage Javan54]CCW41049.1 hypothetical protein MSA_21950 [Streptococcus agalactiae ILRI005]
MDAKQLIKELQTIPKFIRDLEEDRQATLSLVYGSHGYSDTRVQTSKTNAQEAKTVAYLDKNDYMLKHIEQLHQERQRMLEYVYAVKDMKLVLVLITIINSQTLTEAQDRLEIGKSKFFREKKKAMNALEYVIKTRITTNSFL